MLAAVVATALIQTISHKLRCKLWFDFQNSNYTTPSHITVIYPSRVAGGRHELQLYLAELSRNPDIARLSIVDMHSHQAMHCSHAQ
jgi:hypothetical protein